MKILVKFRKDWADEFDVEGWKLFDSMEDWRLHYEGIKSGEYYFGTNEGWDGSDFSADDFVVGTISMDQAKVLTDLFGESFGHFPS